MYKRQATELTSVHHHQPTQPLLYPRIYDAWYRAELAKFNQMVDGILRNQYDWTPAEETDLVAAEMNSLMDRLGVVDREERLQVERWWKVAEEAEESPAVKEESETVVQVKREATDQLVVQLVQDFAEPILEPESQQQQEVAKENVPPPPPPPAQGVKRKSSTESRSARFTCPHPDCGQLFKQPTTLERHLLLHDRPKPYSCAWTGCRTSSEYRNVIITHIRVNHLGLPKTVKEQESKGIVDHADPRLFLQVDHELLKQLKKK